MNSARSVPNQFVGATNVTPVVSSIDAEVVLRDGLVAEVVVVSNVGQVGPPPSNVPAPRKLMPIPSLTRNRTDDVGSGGPRSSGD
jgi:hypothetical protein